MLGRLVTGRDMDFKEFAWQIALLFATTVFGVLAEWARRMLPDPRDEDQDKPRKLRKVKDPDLEMETDDSDT